MKKKLALTLALICAAAVPAAAQASTTIGPPVPNPDPGLTQAINFNGPALIFSAVAPNGVHLAAPTAGIVTRWQFYSDAVESPLSTAQLRVLQPASLGAYTAIASGPVEPIPVLPSSSTLYRHAFAARLPIAAGQLVGVSINHPPKTGFEVALPSAAGWKVGCFGSGCEETTPPPDGGTGSAFIGFAGQFMALNAEIEPDADGDLYGDETQDNCAGVANPTQADADADGRGDACDKETAVPLSVVPKTAPKKCPKGKKLKRGKCVKKPRKKAPKK